MKNKIDETKIINQAIWELQFLLRDLTVIDPGELYDVLYGKVWETIGTLQGGREYSGVKMPQPTDRVELLQNAVVGKLEAILENDRLWDLSNDGTEMENEIQEILSYVRIFNSVQQIHIHKGNYAGDGDTDEVVK